MISILQILIILFSIFALSRALLRFKDNEIRFTEFILWSLVWVPLIVITFVPEIISPITGALGIGREVDFLIYGGVTFLFYLVFKLFVKIENLQQDITTLTRKIAIKNEKSNKKRQK